MITPEIQIVRARRRWLVEWKRADGTTEREVYGSRKSLHDDFIRILNAVLGDSPFPPIDETIEIHAPGRRMTDVE